MARAGRRSTRCLVHVSSSSGRSFGSDRPGAARSEAIPEQDWRPGGRVMRMEPMTARISWTVAALLLVAAAAPAEAQATRECPGGRFVLLTNGRIHTMDAQRSVVSRVRIANGKFVEV